MSKELVERLRVYADKINAAELFEAADLIERQSKIIEIFRNAGDAISEGREYTALHLIGSAIEEARSLSNKGEERC